MTSIFYRIGPPISVLDEVRQHHQRQVVGTPDDAVIEACGTCYIFDEPWPCAVARLVDVVDEQIEADRAALQSVGEDTPSLDADRRRIVELVARRWAEVPMQRLGQMLMNHARTADGFLDLWEIRDDEWSARLSQEPTR